MKGKAPRFVVVLGLLISLFEAASSVMVTAPHYAGAVASDCTLYASPTGNDANNGTTSSTPKTLSGAAHASVPGSVVCLEAGTYNSSNEFDIPISGSATGWITYESYDPSNVAHLVYTGTALNTGMWFIYNNTNNPNGTNYIKVNDLWFDAGNEAAQAIKCSFSHHIVVSNTYMKNGGESAVMMHHCDYTTIDHNWVYHNGYNQGTGSGIDIHDNNYWYDTAAGFHSYVTNNIVSGSYDNEALPNQTEGNGIIMDSSDIGIISSPPTLIANNVIYENGAYCITVFEEYGHWVVNNTCYKNSLDLYVHNGSTAAFGNNGELSASDGNNNYYVNNIASAWDQQHPLLDNPNITGSTASTWDYDLWYNGDCSTCTNSLATGSSVTGLVHGNPLFVSPLSVSYTGNVATDNNQEQNAPDPTTIGNDFALQSGSPAIGAGVNPTTLTTDTAIQSGLRQYTYTDILGNSRPSGGPFDLGAYEYQAPSNSCAPVTWTNIVNATASGNTLTDPSTASWNSGGTSTTVVSSGDVATYVTADATNVGRMIGLNHDESTASYTDIDYAIELQSNGTLVIYENGVDKKDTWTPSSLGTYAVGDVLKVAVEGGVVHYYKNGLLLYTSTVTPTYPLFTDGAIRDAGGKLSSAYVCNGNTNLIQNPSFESGISPWFINLHNAATTSAGLVQDATVFEDGTHSGSVAITGLGSPQNDWNVQIGQTGLTLQSGHAYVLSYYARSTTASRVIRASLQQDASPFTQYVTSSCTLGAASTWQQCTLTFTPTSTLSGTDIWFNIGTNTDTVWLDNVSLTG